MTSHRIPFSIYFALLLLLVSAGCSSRVKSDEQLQAKIQQNLASDPVLTGQLIHVEVRNKVAAISGTVANQDQIQAVTKDADIPDIVQVINELAINQIPTNVGPTGSSGAQPQNETSTRTKVVQPQVGTQSRAPVIMSVTPIAPRSDQTITIKGSGLGTHAPYTNQDTAYLLIRDMTSKMNAGRVTPNNYDAVTLTVASWSDGQIVVTGLGGAYGARNWKLNPSDEIEVEVWNPQTGVGPAVFKTQVVQHRAVEQQNPTISLQAIPGSVHPGGATMLSWQSTNAATVTINGNPVPLNGSQAFTPAQSTTYQAVAKDQAGQTANAVALVVVTAPAVVVTSTSVTITVPVGTPITVRTIDSIDSDNAHSDQRFHASLEQPLIINGHDVAPKGADVYGRVVDAEKAGRLTGHSELKVELTEIYINKQPQTVTTNIFDRAAPGRGAGTAEMIGGGAAGGAAIGAAAAGGKGAAIGAGIGAGAGTAMREVFGNKALTIPSETVLRFTLQQPFTVTLNQ
jgi:hypothetical protein